ncbi:hypothetical protein C8F04DRAFT_1258431 [Mycena alexandri]|uniref:RING-type domain-containing protein n=1 Tax=Mycena alexandri TaxID=1745969 RepID=A0AAD6SZR6_9AGAR|nr:hypothetical protein C8F04DRAFT_1258431 [Mycena alexandri]
MGRLISLAPSQSTLPLLCAALTPLSFSANKHMCEGHVPCLLYNKSAADMQRIRDALGISSANTHVRSSIERDRRRRGSRGIRDVPLQRDDLYVGSERPPPLTSDRAHQTCSLCLQVKSHPVAYMCGHSHCYVCIRLHLETDWLCPIPDCRQVMRRAPHRHLPEEEGLMLDFPERNDRSAVTYDWEGLTFPRRAAPAVEEI